MYPQNPLESGNFHPYSRRVGPTAAAWTKSPFSELNGFAYNENWLRNLLIASSMNGRRRHRDEHDGMR